MVKLETILVESDKFVSRDEVIQIVSKSIHNQKCVSEDDGPPKEVDCDNQSGHLRGTEKLLNIQSHIICV